MNRSLARFVFERRRHLRPFCTHAVPSNFYHYSRSKARVMRIRRKQMYNIFVTKSNLVYCIDFHYPLGSISSQSEHTAGNIIRYYHERFHQSVHYSLFAGRISTYWVESNRQFAIFRLGCERSVFSDCRG